jgi:hypothetical protein
MAPKSERNERLAAALRENLKRRKARGRTLKTGADGKPAMPSKDQNAEPDRPQSRPEPTVK